MRATRRSLLLALLAPVLLLLPGVVQSGTPNMGARRILPSASILIEVKVKGTTRYTQGDVLAASALRIGVAASEDDFRKAAKELTDSGAFSDVAYSYSYSSAGTKLDLQLTDSKQFLPVRFDDFVWFTDDQLRQKVHERVPLFKGELPISGRLPEQVSDVLQALLVESNVPGHVDYLRNNDPNGKIESITYSVSDLLIESINYSVSDLLIRVRKIEFTGAGPSELPLLEAAARRLPDPEYSRNRINLFAEHQLLPIYHARGYLKASFSQPQPKVVRQETGSSRPKSYRVSSTPKPERRRTRCSSRLIWSRSGTCMGRTAISTPPSNQNLSWTMLRRPPFTILKCEKITFTTWENSSSEVSTIFWLLSCGRAGSCAPVRFTTADTSGSFSPRPTNCFPQTSIGASKPMSPPTRTTRPWTWKFSTR